MFVHATDEQHFSHAKDLNCSGTFLTFFAIAGLLGLDLMRSSRETSERT